MIRIEQIFSFLTAALFLIVVASCGDDDNPLTASVTITTPTQIGDIGGDVTGNGGSYTQTYDYVNQMATADYNMDFTSGPGGSFKMVVQDADGTEVLNRTLIKGQGDDSASGVTSSGTPGTWKVIITLTDFDGDGSFSLSEGN